MNNTLTHAKAKEMVAKALNAFHNSSFAAKSHFVCSFKKKTYSTISDIKNKITPDLNVKIEISNRMFSCAGKASGIRKNGVIAQGNIKLNARLLNRLDDAEIYQTISHELAHVVDFYLRDESDHKEFWQGIHKAMGGNAKRCHNYDIKGISRKQTRHNVYDSILNKTVVMSTTSANRIRRNSIMHSRYEYIGVAI